MLSSHNRMQGIHMGQKRAARWIACLKKITKSEWRWLSKVGTASVLTTLVQQRFTICIVAIWHSVHRFCQPVSLQRRFSLRRFIPLTTGAWPVFITAAIHYQTYTMPNLAKVFIVPCVQWNLQIKDTLGAELLSSFRRLSFGGRFEPICNLQPPQDLIYLDSIYYSLEVDF